MKRILMASAIALLAVLSFAPVASARGRVFIGGGYGFYGPRFYGGWYGPAWYGPGWYGYGGPYYYGAYRNTGNVKIETHVKGDSIFVDGGYAGRTGKLKKFPLRPGTHTIELRDRSGHTYYQERVEVIRGRTIEVRPGLRS
ncbi:MAG TPA: PEGA domain-containing protein [Terriglobia bacterium]|nr:PEGA domain-containing protein [Terriglobia bacterium]